MRFLVLQKKFYSSELVLQSTILGPLITIATGLNKKKETKERKNWRSP